MADRSTSGPTHETTRRLTMRSGAHYDGIKHWTFRRMVDFQPGYDFRNDPEKAKYGWHAMEIRFFLVGPHGATTFGFNTSWYPGWRPFRTPVPTDIGGTEFRSSSLRFVFQCHPNSVPPMSVPTDIGGTEFGWHWKTNLSEDDRHPSEHCKFIGGHCWYNQGSGLYANRVLARFIDQGERVVW